MLRNTLLFLVVTLFLSTSAVAGPFEIAPELHRDLNDQRLLLGETMKELDQLGKQILVAKSDRRAAMASVRRLENEIEQTKAKLEKMQEFDRDNPGAISPEQLRDAESRNRQASRALEEARGKVSGADVKINALSASASEKYAEFLRLQKSFERDVGRVVDSQLQERLRALQMKKEVQATERVACGEDSIPVCKERSKKAAELRASEMGSVVFVNSLTEVKNFKLSREELRSEVQATLSNKVFSNQHMVGETEYETTIKANVEPVIGDTLREQMASAIRSQVYDVVGGRIDFSQVQNPSQFADGVREADEDEEVAPVKSAKSKKKKAVPKEVVQEEAVQEEVVEQEAPQEEAPRQQAPAPAPRKREKPTFTF